ncbi:6-phosphofructokinase [Pelotalea chapellei]|uniref:ATP-dependent 6-phosphofructokinase n=1 Tax=Pelotalea chapellei TaxID=44671 RepID=A0ABS5U4A0_9BACT|nr:6-phosphofructokinase [Pelotalea chapellei]MBT1070478.1 6-phosphofructokinase [Pelotalea chapellei]
MKRLAVLTSGGDCSGMNACIRAVVRTAVRMKIEVIGFRKGYQGLMKGDAINLDSKAVSGILHRGGTFLQSARAIEFKTPEGQQQALSNLREMGIDGMVVLGGDGSLTGALALHRLGFPVVGIPASIDNDIPFTDMSLGVDTALNNILYAVDCIKDTASSHARAFVIEVMGRNSGYLASISAIATGAEFALVPEQAYDLTEICQQLRGRFAEGRDNAIIIVAEGAGHAQEIANSIKDTIGFEVRVTVLGHYQRGGAPTVFDRLLASRFGKKSVELLISGVSGVMVGLSANNMLATPLDDVIRSEKRPHDEVLRMAEVLGI